VIDHSPWPTLPIRRTTFYIAACAIALTCPAFAQIKPARVSTPVVVPADRLSERWWADRHHLIAEKVRAHPDAELLLVGGSIVNNFDKANPFDENLQRV
jgi:hypothetical protein